jgi:protein arginine kinase activator
MKCQHCDRQAVFHITELETGEVRELHLCEEHARSYLNQSEAAAEGPPGKAGGMTAPLGVGQTAEELSVLDQKTCGMCGISFFEFRNQGRLGCPHDYVAFEKELEPLIANIHGVTEHVGRRPQRAAAIPMPAEGTEGLTRVIGLRLEMKEAIAREDYEKAKENRDLIREIEVTWLGQPSASSSPPEATP